MDLFCKFSRNWSYPVLVETVHSSFLHFVIHLKLIVILMCFLLTVNSCCDSVEVCVYNYFIKLFWNSGKSLGNFLKSEGSDNDSNTAPCHCFFYIQGCFKYCHVLECYYRRGLNERLDLLTNSTHDS